MIPATQEAEAGEWFNPGGGGCSELRLHHCTPAWATEQDSVSRKKQTNKQKKREYLLLIYFYFIVVIWKLILFHNDVANPGL